MEVMIKHFWCVFLCPTVYKQNSKLFWVHAKNQYFVTVSIGFWLGQLLV